MVIMHVIIGTGFAGIQCLHELKSAFFTEILVLEKQDTVGGIWNLNTTDILRSELSFLSI